MTFHPAPGGTGFPGLEPGVPAPPPGPGTAPPFASPPTDRDRRRLWWTLGIGGLVLALCGVGGIVGVVALIVRGTEEAKAQASVVVAGYLDAVVDDDYDEAYEYLCDDLAARVDADDLEREHRGLPFSDYTLDEPRIGEYVEIVARLDGSGGRSLLFQLDSAGAGMCILQMATR